MTIHTDPLGATLTGELRVRAERAGRRTVVTELYRTAPFHLGLPAYRDGDGTAGLIVQGVGPGYLPGDRLAIDLAAGAGASLDVRGQGATKLYPSPQGTPTIATVALRVEAGARLTYLPGELIPFRQSMLEQTTRIDVASGGAAILGEIVTPGRVAMGEAYAYARLRLDIEARVDDRLVLLERARLDPGTGGLTSIGRHGAYPVAGTIYAIGDWFPPPAVDIPADVTWALAQSDGYALIRLLGPTAQSVATAIRQLVQPPPAPDRNGGE